MITIHKFIGKNTNIFLYKNKIKVSSDHLVYENNKWIRIHNSKYTTPIQQKEKYIYCINTTSGKIKTPFGIFRDYMEISKKCHMKHISHIILNALNKTTNKNYNYSGNKNWGFNGDTLIKTKDGIHKIKDLYINNEIEGIVKLSTKNTYKYKDIISTGNMIVKKNNTWDFIHNISDTVTLNNDVLYNIITKDGIIEVVTYNNKIITYRDYEQIKSVSVNNAIDKYSEKVLNV